MSANHPFDAFAVTDTGLRRRHNEDAFICESEIGLFLVADGMGGENCGEVASRMTAENFRESITAFITDEDATIPFDHSRKGDPLINALVHIVDQTNQSVIQYAKDYPTHRGMGSTLTAAVISQEILYVAHVGDSRLYAFEDGEPIQITEDHTRVQKLVKRHVLTPEEARTHRQRHIITQCVGRKDRFKPDILKLDLNPNATYLICSDGLCDMLTDNEMAEIIIQNDALEQVGEKLVASANDKGGRDNITVVLFRRHNPITSEEDTG